MDDFRQLYWEMCDDVTISEDEDIKKYDDLMEKIDIIFDIIEATSTVSTIDCKMAIKRMKNILKGADDN